MKVKGIKRFLESLGITPNGNSKNDLVLSNVRSINLRSNGNQFLDIHDKVSFDFEHELIFIKEYYDAEHAKTDLEFDFCIDFFAVTGFSLR